MNKDYRLSIFYVAVVLMTMTFFSTLVFAQKGKKANPLWQAADNSALSTRPTAVPDNVPVYRLNRKLLGEIFAKAPREFTNAARETETILEIPTPDGEMMRFRIEESPMLAPNVAAQFPTWKQFVGQGIDDPTATASFDINDLGFHGYVLSGRGTFVIDPYSQTDKTNYIVYYKGAVGDGNRDSFSCKLGEREGKGIANLFDSGVPQEFTNGNQLRTLRSAWSLTKEYTAFFQNNKSRAFSALQTTVSRMNIIYRRELAVTFIIISDFSTVYDNTNDGGFPPANDSDVASKSNRRNGTVLDTAYGQANYDIGHVLSVTGSPNGLAVSPSLCDNEPFPGPPPPPQQPTGTTSKAQGFTGAPVPQGDGFDVDYVAHEIGHQFAMSHTFNNDVDGSCSTRADDSAYEPASGITIMGYGGICGPRNLAKNSIEYFNIRSFDQGLGYLQSSNLPTPCGTVTATNNTAPTVTSPGNFTIPRLTPFALTAGATDPDGDALTYLWEEFDLGGATGSTPRTVVINMVPTVLRPGMPVDADNDGTARPIFRAYNPTNSGTRTFPSLFYILNPANNDQTANENGVAGNQPTLDYTETLPFAPMTGSTNGYVCAPTETCVRGERLPTIGRTMRFRVAVRDNRTGGGGVADAQSNVTVAAGAGPFQVTTQNASPVSWQANSPQTVTWDVAGTTANNINAGFVNILLSTDGGQTFPVTILANTQNDGTEQITVPNNPTTQARIKIEPVGNIFFDINNANFTITAAAPTITVNPATLPNGTTGTAYEQTITAAGGTAPYSFAVTAGTPPNGLTLTNGGILNGTPTTAATFNFTVTATDANNNTGSRAYSVIIAAAPPPQTFVVDTTSDASLTACTTAANDCSLRGAINKANGAASNDTITFAIPTTDTNCTGGLCTITSATTALPNILNAGTLVIDNASGASRIAVSGNNAVRAFVVASGANLTLTSLTLRDGRSPGSQDGSAITSSGALTLNNVTVSNSVTVGGAGAIVANAGTITLNNSTVSGNTGTNGGGIANNGGTITLNNSTVTGNTSTSLAGGIFNFIGTLNLVNSTVAFNSLTSSTSGANDTGGIRTDNSAVNLTNSIIAGNTVVNAASRPDFRGAIASTSSFNLIGDGTGATGITNGTNGNQVGTGGSGSIDPRLAPLGNYGGATQTHALLSGSTAINNGTATGAPTTDQRGASRIGQVDIGAFELNNLANGGTYRALTNVGRIGASFNYQLTANSGAFTYSLTSGILPPGLAISNSVIAAGPFSITGTPTQPGSYNYTITATDGTNSVATNYTTVIQTTTAASASVSGRVMMTAAGKGLKNAVVTLTDSNGVNRYVRTSLSGRFYFAEVTSGGTYVLSVQSKRYQFEAQVLNIAGDTDDIVFRAVR